MVNKTFGIAIVALMLLFVPFTLSASDRNALSAGDVEEAFGELDFVAVSVPHADMPAPVDLVDSKPVPVDGVGVVDISKREELWNRIFALSEEVARTEHVLLSDDHERSEALRKILVEKGVDPNNIDLFIKSNSIDVDQFKADVDDLIVALRTAQYLGVNALLLYHEGKLGEAEMSLRLAESQAKLYSRLEAQLTAQINSWTVPSNNAAVAVASIKAVPVDAIPEPSFDDVDAGPFIPGDDQALVVGDVVAVDAEVEQITSPTSDNSKKVQKSSSGDTGFFSGFFDWLGDLF